MLRCLAIFQSIAISTTVPKNVAQDLDSIMGLANHHLIPLHPAIATMIRVDDRHMFSQCQDHVVLEVEVAISWSEMADVFTRFPNSEGDR